MPAAGVSDGNPADDIDAYPSHVPATIEHVRTAKARAPSVSRPSNWLSRNPRMRPRLVGVRVVLVADQRARIESVVGRARPPRGRQVAAFVAVPSATGGADALVERKIKIAGEPAGGGKCAHPCLRYAVTVRRGAQPSITIRAERNFDAFLGQVVAHVE